VSNFMFTESGLPGRGIISRIDFPTTFWANISKSENFSI
jgi:hypothetical protein